MKKALHHPSGKTNLPTWRIPHWPSQSTKTWSANPRTSFFWLLVESKFCEKNKLGITKQASPSHQNIYLWSYMFEQTYICPNTFTLLGCWFSTEHQTCRNRVRAGNTWISSYRPACWENIWMKRTTSGTWWLSSLTCGQMLTKPLIVLCIKCIKCLEVRRVPKGHPFWMRCVTPWVTLPVPHLDEVHGGMVWHAEDWIQGRAESMDRMEAMGGGLLVPWCVPNFENPFTTWDHPESPSPWHKVKTASWTILEVINSVLYFILQSEDYQNTQQTSKTKNITKKPHDPTTPPKDPTRPGWLQKNTKLIYGRTVLRPTTRKEGKQHPNADESSTPKSKKGKEKEESSAQPDWRRKNAASWPNPHGPVPEYEMLE